MNEFANTLGAPASNLFVVVEDHYLREKIAGVLSRSPGILMVSQTDTCAKAAQVAEHCCPDAVFVCLRQAVAGAETLRRLRAACSRTRVFAVADCPECAALAAPDALGVDAVLDMATLLSALDWMQQSPGRTLCQGQPVLRAAERPAPWCAMPRSLDSTKR